MQPRLIRPYRLDARKPDSVIRGHSTRGCLKQGHPTQDRLIHAPLMQKLMTDCPTRIRASESVVVRAPALRQASPSKFPMPALPLPIGQSIRMRKNPIAVARRTVVVVARRAVRSPRAGRGMRVAMGKMRIRAGRNRRLPSLLPAQVRQLAAPMHMVTLPGTRMGIHPRARIRQHLQPASARMRRSGRSFMPRSISAPTIAAC